MIGLSAEMVLATELRLWDSGDEVLELIGDDSLTCVWLATLMSGDC